MELRNPEEGGEADPKKGEMRPRQRGTDMGGRRPEGQDREPEKRGQGPERGEWILRK